MPSILTWIGSLLMIHAAYSCLHYRSILQDLDLADGEDSNFSIPPMDVIVQVGIAFGLLLVGELLDVGSLQPVEVITTTKTLGIRRPLQAPAFRTRDFDIYAHRSKGL